MKIGSESRKNYSKDIGVRYGKRLDSFPKRIGITGSPATGKRSVGENLARVLGLEFLSINDYAIHLGYGKWKAKDFLVDIKRLRGAIKTENRIVSGHLLPYVVPDRDLDLILILRCSPMVLRKRYESRGYSEDKIRENIEAEAIGIIAEKCIHEYDSAKIAELDMSRIKNPMTAVIKILDIIIGKKRMSFGAIDWLSSARTPSDLERVLRGKYHTLNKTKKDN